jgi:hypothetical protein
LDITDAALVDAEYGGEFALQQTAVADEPNVVFRQAGLGMGASAIAAETSALPGACAPVLSWDQTAAFACLSVVVGLSSGVQMCWLDADWPIALVQDVSPSGDGADEKLVADTVSAVPRPDPSVSELVSGAAPVPTGLLFGWQPLDMRWLFGHEPVEGLESIKACRHATASVSPRHVGKFTAKEGGDK